MSEAKSAAFAQNVHPNTHEDDFRTPAYLFDWINDIFGPVEYDAACDENNNLAPPLRLEDDWPTGSVIYTNPPFDSQSIIAWFDKGRIHADNGGIHIMCLPNKLCQTFFTERISQCDEILLLGGRVDFSGPFSTPGGASRSGTVVIVQHWDRPFSPIVRGMRLRDLKARYKQKGELV